MTLLVCESVLQNRTAGDLQEKLELLFPPGITSPSGFLSFPLVKSPIYHNTLPFDRRACLERRACVQKEDAVFFLVFSHDWVPTPGHAGKSSRLDL